VANKENKIAGFDRKPTGFPKPVCSGDGLPPFFLKKYFVFFAKFVKIEKKTHMEK
jgi:hypothetical protein